MEVHAAFRPDVTVWTDASGAWGCGGSTDGFSALGTASGSQRACTATKELLSIVLAVAVWGPHWQTKHLLQHGYRSSNQCAELSGPLSATSDEMLAFLLSLV